MAVPNGCLYRGVPAVHICIYVCMLLRIPHQSDSQNFYMKILIFVKLSHICI
jgi:hypothetical protein